MSILVAILTVITVVCSIATAVVSQRTVRRLQQELDDMNAMLDNILVEGPDE